ncbi:MAG: FtsQ-type POTRA domain-containing protein [Patescibacteria group bacterium]
MALKKVSISRKRLRRKRFLRRTLAFLFLSAGISAGIVALFYLPQVKIRKVAVEGQEVLSADKIKMEAEEVLAGKYLGLIPKNTIFLIPKNEIKRKILDDFSRVKKMSIKRDWPLSLAISIVERQGKALWCAGDTSCAFLDEDGMIFEPSPVFSGRVFAKFLDERAQKSGLGQEMISPNEFRKLLAFKNFLEDEFGFQTDKMVLKDFGEYEFFMSAGWRILLNETESQSELFENFRIAFENELKDKSENLDYLDLRFGNKIFYKFR